MKSKSSEFRFEREADVCAAFIEAAQRDQKDWRFYPETEGWDILAVRSDGIQVGIEAKLRLNNKVVAQALPERWQYGTLGPDFRAVLVPLPGCENDLVPICHALGIAVISIYKRENWGKQWFSYDSHLPDSRYSNSSEWHEWCPVKRHPVPAYVPDVIAGASAPLQLTQWKIKAIKLAIVLEGRPVSRADFKAVGIDPGRWLEPSMGWLRKTDSGFVPGSRMPDFKSQHPKNYEEIKADREKWDWTSNLVGTL